MPHRPPPIIIRTLFLLPILLCLAGWLWSSTHYTDVEYGYGERGRAVGLWTNAGALGFEWFRGCKSPGWMSYNEPRDRLVFWPSKEATGDAPSFLGFAYSDLGLGMGAYIRVLIVPYWFLIVVCGGIFAWVWRQTRRKPVPKTAFPVEVAAAGGGRDSPRQTQTP